MPSFDPNKSLNVTIIVQIQNHLGICGHPLESNPFVYSPIEWSVSVFHLMRFLFIPPKKSIPNFILGRNVFLGEYWYRWLMVEITRKKQRRFLWRCSRWIVARMRIEDEDNRELKTKTKAVVMEVFSISDCLHTHIVGKKEM